MNDLTYGEEISKLEVLSNKSYNSFQSAANLNISQNFFKNCFLKKLLPQKLYTKEKI